MRLTQQLLTTYYGASIDLGPGYPSFNLPNWLYVLATSGEYLKTMHNLSSHEHRKLLKQSDSLLVKKVLDLLELDNSMVDNCFLTSSGAEAINRVLAYLSEYYTRITFLIPAIDLYYDFSKELCFDSSYFKAEISKPIVVSDLIEHLIENESEIVFLTLPNNPTGTSISSADLGVLANFCKKKNIVMVLDICFALVGEESEFLSYFNKLDDDLSCIILWDTGKTFGLRHRKIGFIWSSQNINSDLQETVKNITFELPLSEKLFFIDVLNEAINHHHVQKINATIKINKQLVKQELSNLIQVYTPEAGSFAILDLTTLSGINSKKYDTIMMDIYKDTSLGVISWNAFYPRSKRNTDRFLRICLSRNTDVLSEGLIKIKKYLNNVT